MLQVMPCGPCYGVSHWLPASERCKTCDRRQPGYAETENYSFTDAAPGTFPIAPITPAAYWYTPPVGHADEPRAICPNHISLLDTQIADVGEQLAALLKVRDARAAFVAANLPEQPVAIYRPNGPLDWEGVDIDAVHRDR